METKQFTDKEFFDYSFNNGLTQDRPAYLNLHYNFGRWLLNEFKPGSFLDIGAGPGALVEFMNTQNIEKAHGLELNPFSVEYFKKRNPDFADKIFTEKAQTFLKNKHYELITSIEVFEHIPDDELNKILPRLAPSCKYFVFSSTPHASTPEFDKHWGHINLKPSDEWQRIFENYGFSRMNIQTPITPWAMSFKSCFL